MSFQSVVTNLSPTHWWRDDGNGALVDVVGSLDMTNNGLTAGVSVPDAPGLGLGVEGDGNGFAESAVDNSYRNNGTFTKVVFVRFSGQGDDHRVFYYGPADGSGNASTGALGVNSETPRGIGFWGTNNDVRGPAVELSVTYMIVGVSDNGTESLFVQRSNETQLSSFSGGASLGSVSGDHRFAIGPSGNADRRPEGIIAEPMFWNNQALSTSQLQDIADAAFAVEGELSFTGQNRIRFADDETDANDATVVAVRKGVEATPAQGVTDSNGEATLTGIDAGTYRTWAEKEVNGEIKTTQVIIREVT